MKEWNKLDSDKRRCQLYKSFAKAPLNFIRPSENKIFNIHDQVGVKLLTRLRLGLSHLCEHKFDIILKTFPLASALATLRPRQCCIFPTVPVKCQYSAELRRAYQYPVIW